MTINFFRAALAAALAVAGAGAFLCDRPAKAAGGIEQSTVSVGGVNAALLTPPHPHGALVLLAGGDGNIGVGADGSIAREGNQLVRTRAAYAARGFAVLVPDCCVNVAAAVDYMSKFGKVTLVGTSRGTQRAARGVAAGGRPAGPARAHVGLPQRRLGRPRQRHRHSRLARRSAADPDRPSSSRRMRQDRPGGRCALPRLGRRTRPGGRLDGGTSEGPPCEAFAHHGFNGIDGQVVGVVSGFAAR
jgi:hypothetical protein